jgi:tyrosyl-DNA phosphodiesterase 1
MPEMFGTHHTKVCLFQQQCSTQANYNTQMLILLRHDEKAQVIIHTANMIPFDWGNMAQAVWKSPLLPLATDIAPSTQTEEIGNGSKFKTDLLNYLRAYDSKRTICEPLIEQRGVGQA